MQSCEKKELITENNNEAELNSSVMHSPEIINGILHFQDNEEFNLFMTAASEMTFEEKENYETKINFLSQQRIFEQIIAAELKLDEPYNNLTEEEISKIKVMPPRHSNIYYSYLNSGVIEECYKGTDDEYYELSIFNPVLASVVNKDGIYSVGDTIFQITEDSEKMMTNGDFSKTKLLKETNVTNEAENITVFTFNNVEKTSYYNPTEVWKSSGGGKKGEKRIGLKIYFQSLRVYYNPNGGDHKYRTYHNVFVKCQERNWLRKWKYKTTQVWLNGNWRYDEKLHVYNASRNKYYPYVSSLSSSVSPYTGGTAPYESYWVWYYERPYSPGDLVNAHWTATRPGGSNGLTVTLNY